MTALLVLPFAASIATLREPRPTSQAGTSLSASCPLSSDAECQGLVLVLSIHLVPKVVCADNVSSGSSGEHRDPCSQERCAALGLDSNADRSFVPATSAESCRSVASPSCAILIARGLEIPTLPHRTPPHRPAVQRHPNPPARNTLNATPVYFNSALPLKHLVRSQCHSVEADSNASIRLRISIHVAAVCPRGWGRIAAPTRGSKVSLVHGDDVL